MQMVDECVRLMTEMPYYRHCAVRHSMMVAPVRFFRPDLRYPNPKFASHRIAAYLREQARVEASMIKQAVATAQFIAEKKMKKGKSESIKKIKKNKPMTHHEKENIISKISINQKQLKNIPTYAGLYTKRSFSGSSNSKSTNSLSRNHPKKKSVIASSKSLNTNHHSPIKPVKLFAKPTIKSVKPNQQSNNQKTIRSPNKNHYHPKSATPNKKPSFEHAFETLSLDDQKTLTPSTPIEPVTKKARYEKFNIFRNWKSMDGTTKTNYLAELEKHRDWNRLKMRLNRENRVQLNKEYNQLIIHLSKILQEIDDIKHTEERHRHVTNPNATEILSKSRKRTTERDSKPSPHTKNFGISSSEVANQQRLYHVIEHEVNTNTVLDITNKVHDDVAHVGPQFMMTNAIIQKLAMVEILLIPLPGTWSPLDDYIKHKLCYRKIIIVTPWILQCDRSLKRAVHNIFEDLNYIDPRIPPSIKVQNPCAT